MRLRIEPAIDGLGIEVPTPLTADEAVENFFDPDFCSSLDLLRKDKNWGKPEPVPPSAKIPIYLLFIMFIKLRHYEKATKFESIFHLF